MDKLALKRHFNRQVLILAVTTLVVGAVLASLAGEFSRARAQAELELRSNQVLALHKETIFGLLDKYRLMTVMVSRRPDTARMFALQSGASGNEVSADPDILKNFSGLLAAMSGANKVSLALPNGKIIAQSSLAPVLERSIDENLRVAAIQDRLGRATIFSPDGLNTYAFAASVRDKGKIVGLVNVDVGLQELENAWALSDDLIFVTDDTGRFIVGNQLSSQLPANNFGPWGNQLQKTQVFGAGQNRVFWARGENYPHIGWTLNVFLSDKPLKEAWFNAAIISILLVLVISTLVFILLQRRRDILFRLETERNLASLLEKTVEKRTSQLRGSNKKLRKEFAERLAAEAALKKAQDSLIQSAKLAAIGQMSTALAHEYNQPLAAIRSYADNARSFLSRKNPKSADENMQRITKMTERMAQLSKTLKTFARKPRTKFKPVEVGPLLEEAKLLVEPSAKKQRVQIVILPPDKGLNVMAGEVRLSQVVVNLLSNAIDAVANSKKRQVFLSAGIEEKMVFICVEDTGPGVPPEDSHKIFDAFFTSKDVGEGLGLGLSIAYNIVHDFGGEILVKQSQKGGAAFTISLPVASSS